MKTVVRKLKQIKNICSKHDKCTYCPMYRGYQCVAYGVIDELLKNGTPKNWDIDEIERIVY